MLFLKNGFLPIIPILLWNSYFYRKLPASYQKPLFDKDIPRFIETGENILRVLVFSFPVFIKLNYGSTKGVVLFTFGTLLYFASWLMLIYKPNSKAAKSALGFTAPASLPLIWLLGISFMADSFYFALPFSQWYYSIIAFLFVCFHFSHAFIVYKRGG